jgi:tetratricopeptide (TPR) repeat protein
LKEKQYDKAIGQLEKAVELNGDNVYAYCKLTRAYGLKYLKAQPLDIFRGEYKKKSLLNYQKAQEADTSDELRIGWLRSWLQGKGILE